MRKRMFLLWLLSLIVFFAGCQGAPAFAAQGRWCAVARPPAAHSLARPVPGAVTSDWGLDCATGRGHRGLDLYAPAGTPVLAAADGTVAFTGYTPAEGGGITVSIRHPGGFRTTYLHLQQVTVAAGQTVRRGMRIALSAGPAIHFGMPAESGADQYFDPSLYLAPPAGVSPVNKTPPPSAGQTAVAPAVPATSAPDTGQVPAAGAFATVNAGHAAGNAITTPANRSANAGNKTVAASVLQVMTPAGRQTAAAARVQSPAAKVWPDPASRTDESVKPAPASSSPGVAAGSVPASGGSQTAHAAATLMATALLLGSCLLAGRMSARRGVPAHAAT